MIGLLAAFLLVAQDKPPERCSIAGTVVDSVTGRPLNKVQLSLEREPREQDLGTVTNAEGRFAMSGIEPGTYRLRATRNGYQERFYGARRTGTTGTTIRLSAGQELGGLEIRLLPFALISGTVRDAEGEPLVGVNVRGLRWMYIGSKRRLVPTGNATTDDLGQYRLSQLRPGKYLLRVEPKTNTDAIDRTAGERRPREFDTITYYPGVTDWTAAAAVDLAVGAHAAGMDVTVRRTPLFRVVCRVTAAPGVDGRAGDVRLRKLNSEALYDHSEPSARRNPNGTFEFRSVAPGSYRIEAYTDGVRPSVGSALVDVGASDVEGVAVVIRPGVEVAGRFRVEGEWKGQLPDSTLTFDSGEHSIAGRAATDGTFTVGLPPGRYTVEYYPGWREPLFLKAARAGSIDVLTEGLVVSDTGKMQIELVLSAEGGQIAGTAIGADDNPFPGATVVLVPEPKLRAQTQRFQITDTDQYGRYEFNGIAPGEYKIFAWDHVEPGSWFDSDFLKQCENSGEPVTVRARQQSETVKVRIAAPE